MQTKQHHQSTSTLLYTNMLSLYWRSCQQTGLYTVAEILKNIFFVNKNLKMFYLLDKQKLKNNFFFVLDISTFSYTLNREGKKTFFPLPKKCFLVPLYSKCIKKLSNFHWHQQNCFVFSLSFFGFGLSNE